jgi:hypothetical protein
MSNPIYDILKDWTTINASRSSTSAMLMAYVPLCAIQIDSAEFKIDSICHAMLF